jgi:hypothetical protein
MQRLLLIAEPAAAKLNLISMSFTQHFTKCWVNDMDMRFHFVAFCSLLTPRVLNPVWRDEAAMSLLFFSWQCILLGFASVIFSDVPKRLNSAILLNNLLRFFIVPSGDKPRTNTYFTLTESKTLHFVRVITATIGDLCYTHESRSLTHVTQRSVMWPAPMVPPANQIILPGMNSRHKFAVPAQTSTIWAHFVSVWP